MAPFESPNYTQVPNDLFEKYLAEMGDAELRVVLALVRYTFGYHRDAAQLSVRKLQELTGLSNQAVQDGAQAAVDRGLFKKNVIGQNTTLWMLCVLPSSTPEPEVYSPVVQGVLPSSTQSGLNKDLKEKRLSHGDIKRNQNQPPTQAELPTLSLDFETEADHVLQEAVVKEAAARSRKGASKFPTMAAKEQWHQITAGVPRVTVEAWVSKALVATGTYALPNLIAYIGALRKDWAPTAAPVVQTGGEIRVSTINTQGKERNTTNWRINNG